MDNIKKLKAISSYFPYGLKGIDKDGLYKGVRDLIFGTFEYFVTEVNPYLFSMDDLTSPIELNGNKFIPLLELFTIAIGNYESNYKGFSVISPTWIQVEIEGKKTYHFRLIYDGYNPEIGEAGYSFEMLSLDMNSSNKRREKILFNNVLFEKLKEWKFNLFGLSSGEYIKINDENNPYKL